VRSCGGHTHAGCFDRPVMQAGANACLACHRPAPRGGPANAGALGLAERAWDPASSRADPAALILHACSTSSRMHRAACAPHVRRAVQLGDAVRTLLYCEHESAWAARPPHTQSQLAAHMVLTLSQCVGEPPGAPRTPMASHGRPAARQRSACPPHGRPSALRQHAHSLLLLHCTTRSARGCQQCI